MKITIHRGANQIGGCITEIQSAAGDKILIDFGHNLPKGDQKAEDKYENRETLMQVLQGVSDVYYTHYHGDHIAFEYEIYKAGVRQHIGGMALKMLRTLKQHLWKADGLKDAAAKSLEALAHFETYRAARTETIGDISITPYFVSHSAVDAYMFLIECDGVTILHTGDFRDHGYLGGGLMKNLKCNIVPKNVDVLISEGTMLARKDEEVMTEWELLDIAEDIMDEYKNVFVLCSSTDADRIATMYQATRRCSHNFRWLVTDTYQGKQIQNIRNSQIRFYSSIVYRDFVLDHDATLADMLKDGFTMLVRDSASFEKYLEEIVPQIDLNQTALIYSQFSGYIDPGHPAFNQSTYNFVRKYPWHLEYLHTSGHAPQQTLREVCEFVNPSMAIIPIHREAQSDLSVLGLSPKLQERIVTKSTELTKDGHWNDTPVTIEIKD